MKSRAAWGALALRVVAPIVLTLMLAPRAASADASWSREMLGTWLARADSLFTAERFAAADSLARESLRLAATEPVDSTLLARALGRLAMTSTKQPEPRVRESAEDLERARSLAERRLGRDSAENAWAHLALARLADFDQDRASAMAHVALAIEIREGLYGPDAELVARALVPLANLERATGGLDRAEEHFTRALAIYRAKVGESSELTAGVYGSLSQVQAARGEYLAASENAERSLAIREALFGPDHRNTANALFAVALAAGRTSNQERALEAIRRARAIFARDYGDSSIQAVTALSVEADALAALGDFADARALSSRSLELKIALSGPNDPNVAVTLNNLATILVELGLYDEAYEKLERTAEILRAVGGDDNPELVTVHNNLAVLKSLAGDEEAAVREARAALELCERLPPDLDADRASTLATLAGTFSELGRYEAADSMLVRAISILTKVAGAENDEVGDAWNLRAELAQAHGRLADARRYQERGVAILEKARGKEVSRTATEEGDLAEILLELGDLHAAETRNAGLATLLSHELGPIHPEVAKARWREAMLMATKGKYDQAITAALEAESLRRAHVRLTIETMAEREALAYAIKSPPGIDLALAIAAAHPPDDVSELWSAEASSRGLVLGALATRARGVVAAVATDSRGASASDSLWTRVLASRRRYARFLVAGGEDDASKLAEARDAYEANERAWAVANRGTARAEDVRLSSLASALQPGQALVAYARWSVPAFVPRLLGHGATRDGYVAFVLPSRDARPSMIPLGDAASIDSLVFTWRRAVLAGDATEESTLRAGGEALRSRVWDPVVARLGGARDVAMVADGALQLVNFVALPRGDGGYLVDDDLLLHVLTSERDLLDARDLADANGRLEARDQRTPSIGLLAIGDVDFDGDPNHQPKGLTAKVASAVEDLRAALHFRGAPAPCEEALKAHFDRLPGTRREIDEIADDWSKVAEGGRVVTLSGEDATEGELKRLAPQARVLHLATHGFVRADQCITLPGTRGIGAVGTPVGANEGAGTDAEPTRANERPEDLLRLAGVALAGANHRADAPLDQEDGILSAEELASLDLSRTDWVVLSACDTGVGEVRSGEGVFGLRRALRTAGAKVAILSLWPVEDRATLSLMTALYEHRWLRGESTALAMREAQRELLHARQGRGESTRPFYWGGFIAAGE